MMTRTTTRTSELELSDFSDDEDVSLFLLSEFSRARLRVP